VKSGRELRIWVRLWPVVAPSLLVTVIAVAALAAGNDVLTRIVLKLLIYVTLTVGFYIFAGNSGIVPFGHVAFMAIGGYLSALLTLPVEQKAFHLPNLPQFLGHAHMSLLPAALLGSAVSAAIAVVLGAVLMRLDGLGASIGSFSFLIITYVVIGNWNNVTGGTGLLTRIPTDLTIPQALVVALGVIGGAYLYQDSRFGRRLRATREDKAAALAVGVKPVPERTIAYALSAFAVAMAGGLYGHFVGILSPDDFYLATTFLVIAMLIVGGIGSLAGAVVGAVVVTGISEGLLRVEYGFNIGSIHVQTPAGLQELGLALFLLLALIFRPNGIMGGKEIDWPWRRSLARPSGAGRGWTGGTRPGPESIPDRI
jgi:branched-chain amino acid transport system permease protein